VPPQRRLISIAWQSQPPAHVSITVCIMMASCITWHARSSLSVSCLLNCRCLSRARRVVKSSADGMTCMSLCGHVCLCVCLCVSVCVSVSLCVSLSVCRVSHAPSSRFTVTKSIANRSIAPCAASALPTFIPAKQPTKQASSQTEPATGIEMLCCCCTQHIESLS